MHDQLDHRGSGGTQVRPNYSCTTLTCSVISSLMHQQILDQMDFQLAGAHGGPLDDLGADGLNSVSDFQRFSLSLYRSRYNYPRHQSLLFQVRLIIGELLKFSSK